MVTPHQTPPPQTPPPHSRTLLSTSSFSPLVLKKDEATVYAQVSGTTDSQSDVRLFKPCPLDWSQSDGPMCFSLFLFWYSLLCECDSVFIIIVIVIIIIMVRRSFVLSMLCIFSELHDSVVWC